MWRETEKIITVALPQVTQPTSIPVLAFLDAAPHAWLESPPIAHKGINQGPDKIASRANLIRHENDAGLWRRVFFVVVYQGRRVFNEKHTLRDINGERRVDRMQLSSKCKLKVIRKDLKPQQTSNPSEGCWTHRRVAGGVSGLPGNPWAWTFFFHEISVKSDYVVFPEFVWSRFLFDFKNITPLESHGQQSPTSAWVWRWVPVPSVAKKVAALPADRSDWPRTAQTQAGQSGLTDWQLNTKKFWV